jgi:protein dithiol oxidoreductase (disulfide-forming)
VQLHTQWSESMKSFQRGYYTATTLKIKDKVQMAVFNAVHKDGKPPVTAEEWAALFTAYGVSKQSVLSTFDSFVVSGMMGQADTRARAFKISSTPELVVDGKYRISTPSGMPEADAHQEMVKIATFLVEQVRAERAAKH